MLLSYVKCLATVSSAKAITINPRVEKNARDLMKYILMLLEFIVVDSYQSIKTKCATSTIVHLVIGIFAGRMSQLSILHFNDIYNVEPNSTREPIGGAARFLTAVKSFNHLNPLVLFSGDAFSPSMRKC